MAKYWIAGVLILLISPLWGGQVGSQYKRDTMLFQFLFNEVHDSGPDFLDTSTHAYVATNSGTGNAFVSGKHGGAVSFDGNGHLALETIPGTPENYIKSFTCIVSIRPRNTSAVTVSVVRQVDDVGADWFVGFLNIRKPRLRFACLGSGCVEGTTGTTDIATADTLDPDTWYHIAYVRKSGGYARIYVNGEIKAEATTQNNTMNLTSGPTLVQWTIGNLFNNAQDFLGELDELTWWREAFTSGEVEELYKQWAGKRRQLLQ